MPTIAISGAGSGIGHTFLKHFALDASNTIYAIDRSFADTVANDADSTRATIHEHTVDTSSQSSINDFSAAIGPVPIDLFIHSAAVRGLVAAGAGKLQGSDPRDAELMEVMDIDTMNTTLQINVTGSFLLIRSLVPNLRAAADEEAKNKSGQNTGRAGMVVVMGSRMGSIAANKDGGAYAYRASKAGLNALVKSFSIDIPELIFVTIHPGRVESRMTPKREEGAVDPEEAIDVMVQLIDGFGREDSGKFYTRDGEVIPW